jgi:hypothetical protein
MAFIPEFIFPRRGRATQRRVDPAFDARRIGGTHPTPGMPDIARLMAAARKQPQLSLIEWDGDGATPVFTLSANEESVAPRELDGLRRRIRDRYIGARFPGVARNAADLASASRVIKAARLYFEEEDVASALELLQLAVEEAPREASLWLARLEILFLARDGEGFIACAREFRALHRENGAWDEVLRLGRALVPGEALFIEAGGPRAHDHYGPWPDLPNWIQAPWDLTGEVLAADFHRAMGRVQGARQVAPPLAA